MDKPELYVTLLLAMGVELGVLDKGRKECMETGLGECDLKCSDDGEFGEFMSKSDLIRWLALSSSWLWSQLDNRFFLYVLGLVAAEMESSLLHLSLYCFIRLLACNCSWNRCSCCWIGLCSLWVLHEPLSDRSSRQLSMSSSSKSLSLSAASNDLRCMPRQSGT